MSKEIKVANDGINVTSNILKTTSTFLDKKLDEKLIADIAKVVACGELVKCVLGLLTPSKPDPVMQKLEQLSEQIRSLDQKMTSHFSDLKVFATTHHFYATFVEPTATMMTYLRKAISNPCADTSGCFRDVSHNPATPWKLANKMIDHAKHNPENPLAKAMDDDPLKTSVTFDKWRTVYMGVLNKLLYLEGMVNGMFWDSNMIGPNELVKDIAEFQEYLNGLEQEYKKKRLYWPAGIQRVIEETQEKNEDCGNAEKAVILKQKFQEILTDDSFYIIVYDDCSGSDHHGFLGDQYVFSFHKNGCNVVVGQSTVMNPEGRAIEMNLGNMERQVENSFKGVFDPKCTRETLEYLEKNIHNSGFIGLIKKCHNPHIRSVNSWREWGPGWWKTVHALGFFHNEPWILIAGYH